MNEIYLSKQSKKIYLEDFERLLLNDNPFWNIDEEIKSYLIKINNNENIQTLYSNYGTNNNILGSYIEFCYYEKIEGKLFKEVIPEILCEFNNSDESCIYEFNYPRENRNYEEDNKLGFSCTDNSEHFRINTIIVTYKSYDSNHLKFWNFITEKLITL